MTSICALEFSVIPLHCENFLCLEARFIELMIDVRRNHKIIFIFKKGKKIALQRERGRKITIDKNMFRPIRPLFLLRGKRIKTRRVHIRHSIALDKVGKKFFKASARVSQARGGGKTAAASDKDIPRPSKRFSPAQNRSIFLSSFNTNYAPITENRF